MIFFQDVFFVIYNEYKTHDEERYRLYFSYSISGFYMVSVLKSAVFKYISVNIVQTDRFRYNTGRSFVFSRVFSFASPCSIVTKLLLLLKIIQEYIQLEMINQTYRNYTRVNKINNKTFV